MKRRTFCQGAILAMVALASEANGQRGNSITPALASEASGQRDNAITPAPASEASGQRDNSNVRAPARAEPIHATLYKNPQCTCCEGYAAYLRQHGFEVDVKPTNDLTEISSKAGVPERLQGCHTMFVEGYVVDGHVPVNAVRKLLSERPAIAGITLPGMPAGSPGMTGYKQGPFTIYAVTKDGAPPKVYAIE